MQSGTWTWELRGLVALGVSQCTNVTDAPTVYTDVGRLSNWITRKIHQISKEPAWNWAVPITQKTTTTTTTAKTTTTTRPVPAKNSPVLNRRTNDYNSLSFSYVFPSYLRHLDDSAEDVATEK